MIPLQAVGYFTLQEVHNGVHPKILIGQRSNFFLYLGPGHHRVRSQEEKTHVGEFQTLLLKEDRQQQDELEEGKKEVKQLLNKR